LLLTMKGEENELLGSRAAPASTVRMGVNVIAPERSVHTSTAIDIHFTT
jgi:hypothetical protein